MCMHENPKDQKRDGSSLTVLLEPSFFFIPTFKIILSYDILCVRVSSAIVLLHSYGDDDTINIYVMHHTVILSLVMCAVCWHFSPHITFRVLSVDKYHFFSLMPLGNCDEIVAMREHMSNTSSIVCCCCCCCCCIEREYQTNITIRANSGSCRRSIQSKLLNLISPYKASKSVWFFFNLRFYLLSSLSFSLLLHRIFYLYMCTILEES